MKNLIIKILLFVLLVSSPIFSYAIGVWVTGGDNIRITTENTWRSPNNEELEQMWSDWNFFYVWTWWEKWFKWLLLNIARDLRAIVFSFVLFLVVIMVIKLLFGENTEEEQKKLKKWILWSSIWIMVMQVAFSVYKILFDKEVWAALARRSREKIVEPFTELLMLLASFIFITMAIIAFYKIVTAWGNEEKIKKWKTTIFQAIIWFIVIKFSSIIVKNTFNPDCWGWGLISYWWTNVCENVKENSLIIITLINWINTFLRIVVVLMIIYAWFLVMTWWWEEEKNKKAKRIILYSWIWLLILFASYLILTFFIIPESKI
jgi:hypothetical protein